MGGPCVRLLGLVLVAELLSGCATGPADPTLDAEVKRFQARADTACIYVVPSNSAAAVTPCLLGQCDRGRGKSGGRHPQVDPAEKVAGGQPGGGPGSGAAPHRDEAGGKGIPGFVMGDALTRKERRQYGKA